MNRTLLSLAALLVALASCNREEKTPEKKAGTAPPPQKRILADAPHLDPNKKTSLPNAAGVNDAVEGLKALAGNRAMKAAARADMMSLAHAVEQFEVDYDQLPQPASAVKGIDCESDTGGEEGLVAIIKGKDEEQNVRKTDYMGEVKESKFTGGKHSRGLEVDGKMLALYDPWFKLYHISLDLDQDGKIADPSAPGNPTAEPNITKKKIIVWSDGPDGEQETWQDNVCSWKE